VTCVNSNYDNYSIVAGTKDNIGIVFKSSFSDEFDYILVGHHDIIVNLYLKIDLC